MGVGLSTAPIHHPVGLLPNIRIIFIIFDLSSQRPVPNLRSEPRPLLKRGNSHFLFHVPCIMRLVCPIVGLPYRVIFAFIVITLFRSNITTGLAKLFWELSVTVGIVLAALDQKEFTTVSALIWHIVLLDTILKEDCFKN